MTFTVGFLLAGAVLVLMALAGSLLRRLPLSASVLYLGLGALLGPAGVGFVRLDPLEHAHVLERVTEVAVIVSLFTAGLKLRAPLADRRWRLPALLASVSMLVSVGLVAAAGYLLLDLPLGAAVLLGALVAPTDPVLASDVQSEHPYDRDRVRFALTGEAGLNDGTAFPFVLLGLGLLGLEGLGPGGLRFLAVDVLWAVPAGLAVGGGLGLAIGRVVVRLRAGYGHAVGLDEFLALGLIALSYGTAVLIHAYGFLAVFAAGLALRRVERRVTGDEPPPELREIARVGRHEEIATHAEKAPAYMAQAVLGFNEQLERIGEVVVVVLVGAMLFARPLPVEALWLAPLLLLVVRPLSVLAVLVGQPVGPLQRRLIAWFGVRGIGSIYYLAYAIGHGLDEGTAELLSGLVLAVVAVSIVVHGISVTPLMSLYERRLQRAVRPAARAVGDDG